MQVNPPQMSNYNNYNNNPVKSNGNLNGGSNANVNQGNLFTNNNNYNFNNYNNNNNFQNYNNNGYANNFNNNTNNVQNNYNNQGSMSYNKSRYSMPANPPVQPIKYPLMPNNQTSSKKELKHLFTIFFFR